ncbi:MAG: peptidoglycan editing factor PgeF [Hyphomicrobiales bacterium]|nr:peptidoglycan editing factor PgeF [Hyphomicrobiales bacterium]
MLDHTGPEPLRSARLEAARRSGIRHGFFTRKGGVSTGLYDGLNVGMGSGDNRASVTENRARVARWMGVAPDALVSVHQIHSPEVIVVTEPWGAERPKADAMATATSGIVIGVLTADCGPVLFADAEARVIGAAHAGWKGALTGVLESTIAAMVGLGARRENILAELGPSIGNGNYEVGPEFVARFVEASPDNARYFTPSPKPGHAWFDLNRYTVDRLKAAGVKADFLDRCTYAEEENFYSYRRATHRGEPDYGRQISAIVLEGR